MTESKRPQKGRIFISYRRADSAGYAGRIYDRLVAKFGESAIFMDVDVIEGGVDFVKVLEDAVQSCDVLIALMGKQWLNIADEEGKRRLDNPEDFVRIEVATALKRNIRVIPVLVDGVGMPQSTELPDNLKPLARRNALQVNHHSFNPDVYRLIEHTELALDGVIENLAGEKTARENELKNMKSQTIRFNLRQGMAVLLVGVFVLLAMLGYPAIRSIINPASEPTSTVTLTPTATNTSVWTEVPTSTPTITPTPIPPSDILFQRDFEDGDVGNWSYKNGLWTVAQEPDGNQCLSGTGPSTDTPQIWYNGNIVWTDYALETRVKFTEGRILYIIVHSNVGSKDHYGMALNNDGFGLMRTWSPISNIIPRGLAPIRWYTIRVEIKGDSFSAYMDNDRILETKLSSPIITKGGFGYVIDNDDKICLDDIRVWKLK